MSSRVIVKVQNCGCEDFKELRVAFGDLNNCQLKCPFCFTLEQQPATERLSSIPAMKLDKVKIIRITGGEPFLRQEQIDETACILKALDRTSLPNLELIVLQTNALSTAKQNLSQLLEIELPLLFEVSFKGTNVREYQYLTFQHEISVNQAEAIMNGQLEGYGLLVESCRAKTNMSVLARLGIFHSSTKNPSFKFVFPNTRALMFTPENWAAKFQSVLYSQKGLWSRTYSGKLVVEKLKTPADGTPNMGKRYKRIIERLKQQGLVEEKKASLPATFDRHYLYQKGNEVYWKAAERLHPSV